MNFFMALVLGVIQGLTEFLPISSSGHLLLFENIFGINNGDMFFNILLHFGSLVAVVIVFWRDIITILKNPFSKISQTIIFATIPTIVIALIFNTLFDDYQLNAFVGCGFFISSILILVSCLINRSVKNRTTIEIDKKMGFIIGVVQGVAVLPGISRSGSTICCGLLQGIKREESARFSFLISIPVIIGAMVFKTSEVIKVGLVSANILTYIIGFLASFITSLCTIKLMMKIVKNGNWIWFSLYLFVVAVFVLLNQYVLCLF